MIGKKTVGMIACAILLIIWQSKTIKKRIAAPSGAFNDIITVCVNKTPLKNHTPFKHAGAHFAYERTAPFTNFGQKQTCYVKLVFDPNKANGYAGRYQCGLFGTHANHITTDINEKPCGIFFNRNKLLQKQFEHIDTHAHSANSIQEAVTTLSP